MHLHGSILSENLGAYRVSSQRKSTALRIAWQHGGDDGWDVPTRANTEAGADLALLIGAPAAAEVMRLLGGGAVAVPLARRHVAHWMVARGSSVSEIARTMRVSRRTARRYMKPKDET